jgi:hypothetical protein
MKAKAKSLGIPVGEGFVDRRRYRELPSLLVTRSRADALRSRTRAAHCSRAPSQCPRCRRASSASTAPQRRPLPGARLRFRRRASSSMYPTAVPATHR